MRRMYSSRQISVCEKNAGVPARAVCGVCSVLFFELKEIGMELPVPVYGILASAAETVCFRTPGALLSLPFFFLYDHEKEDKKRMRYFFYVFYPAHLAVLGMIRLSMNI